MNMTQTRPARDPFLSRIQNAVRVLKMPLPGPAKRERGPQIMDLQARVIDAHGRESFHDIKPFPVAVEPLGDNYSMRTLFTDESLHAFDASDAAAGAAWSDVLATLKRLRKGRLLKSAALPRDDEEFYALSLLDWRRNAELRENAMSLLDALLEWARVRDRAHRKAEERRLEVEAQELPSVRRERLERERQERDQREHAARRADLLGADLGAVSAVGGGPWTFS